MAQQAAQQGLFALVLDILERTQDKPDKQGNDAIAAFCRDQSLDAESAKSTIAAARTEWSQRKPGFLRTNSLGMPFAWVPSGTSWLGDEPSEWRAALKAFAVPSGTSWLGGSGGKAGTQQFTLQKGLYCGVYPVTQGEWEAVIGNNPSWFSRTGGGSGAVNGWLGGLLGGGVPDAELKRFPVENVSWNDVQTFIQKLNQKLAKDGLTYRLPTEQEWEYICRGGPISQAQSGYDFYFTRSKTDLTPQPTNNLVQANFNNALGRTSQVGLYLPNPLGIYDLHGNVWEWTSSLHENGSYRVIRGGSWYDQAEYCSAASRSWNEPGNADRNLGFRLLAVSSQ